MIPAPASGFDYGALTSDAAADLRKQAHNIRARVCATTQIIIEIGHALIGVKKKLQRGDFDLWVEAECGFARRCAYNYIKAAEFAKGKSETVSFLPPNVNNRALAIVEIDAGDGNPPTCLVTSPEIIRELAIRMFAAAKAILESKS